MALKKSDIEKLNEGQKKAKIEELERAILELRGEGRTEKIKPLRKAIAALRTPSNKPLK